MEVHSHAHTPRRKWTHYFWEFLMLFLAVFFGFLAEYQLEHKIEKDRGKQYIRSFTADLQTDTSRFADLIKQYELKLAELSIFVDCYRTETGTPHSDSCLSRLFFASGFFPDLIYTDRTLQQLKNAGGLRLIPAVDADSIIEYDKLLREYQKYETTSYQEIQTAIRNSIYDLNHFGKSTRSTSALYGNDPALINRYFNQLYFYYTSSEGNMAELQKINQKAKSLINYFTKKYHFR
jgi:hypothetical protein